MGGKEEEEVGRRKKRRSPINMGRLLEKGETVTLWDGGHRSGEGGAREERSWGGSLVDTCAGRWVCVGRDTGASGLGAGKGSIFHLDDNHIVSAPYFAGKLYLCFWYFSVIIDMT